MDYLDLNLKEQLVLLNKVLEFLEKNRENILVDVCGNLVAFTVGSYSYSVTDPDLNFFVIRDDQAINISGDNKRVKQKIVEILSLLKVIRDENIKKQKEAFLKNMGL